MAMANDHAFSKARAGGASSASEVRGKVIDQEGREIPQELAE